MTDHVDLPEPDAKPGEPFAIVLTLDGFRRLQARLEALERASAPVELLEATFVGDQGDTAERLDRHRRELEAIKHWCNETAAYLQGILPAGIPQPPKPEDYL